MYFQNPLLEGNTKVGGKLERIKNENIIFSVLLLQGKQKKQVVYVEMVGSS